MRMNSFRSVIEKFDSTLRKFNFVNYRKLQNPLPEREIDNYLKTLEVVDENLKLFFLWKNGFDFSRGISKSDQLFEFGIFLSLEDIIRGKNLNIGPWGTNFFPIAMEFGGDALLFNNEKGPNYGKIHLFSVSLLFIEEPISYYDSLCSMLETITEDYEQGAYIYNEAKMWIDIDFEKDNYISSNHNPQSDFWKTLK